MSFTVLSLVLLLSTALAGIVKLSPALSLCGGVPSIVSSGSPSSQFRGQAIRQLNELAGLVPVMELPLQAGQFYGAIRTDLEGKGETIGNNDLWIAAHAKAAGLTLVTNNDRKFRRIQGLKIQNWVE